MQDIAEFDLPSLPMEGLAISANPLPQFVLLRYQHPSFASCAFGFVITLSKSLRDLLRLDDRMTTAKAAVAAIIGAESTTRRRY